MRKIIFLIHASLDGFVATTKGEMDWVVYNDELEKYSHDLHEHTDVAIYGRVTYEMMEGYWPGVLTNPNATESELAHARWADKATKYVISRTLDTVTWNNTVIIKDNILEEMTKIKQQAGKHIWLLGSPSTAQEFMRLGLIDEYRINVNPVILGKGIPLFDGLVDKLNLKLIEAHTFKDGVVGLRYAPADKG